MLTLASCFIFLRKLAAVVYLLNLPIFEKATLSMCRKALILESGASLSKSFADFLFTQTGSQVMYRVAVPSASLSTIRTHLNGMAITTSQLSTTLKVLLYQETGAPF